MPRALMPATARGSAFATGVDPARRRAVGAGSRSSQKNWSSSPWTSRVASRRSTGGGGRPELAETKTTAGLDGVRLLKFDPDRCSVFFLDTRRTDPEPNRERRYTLTHNDLTRHLTVSVAPDFNGGQTSFFITRVLRDEVLAEWKEDGLHVHCFVSVYGHWWLELAKRLRSSVFRQKLPLVLDALRYAERDLLRTRPALRSAPVFVHFHENERESAPDGSGYDLGTREARARDDGRGEHWGALEDAGKRKGSDGRFGKAPEGREPFSGFSRRRDLWTTAAAAAAAAEEEAFGISAENALDAESVGGMIEGALAGGGEPATVRASR